MGRMELDNHDVAGISQPATKASHHDQNHESSGLVTHIIIDPILDIIFPQVILMRIVSSRLSTASLGRSEEMEQRRVAM